MSRVLVLLVAAWALFAQKSSPSKPVHVHEYTRKDGAVVHAHDRALPSTAGHKTSSPKTSSTTKRTTTVGPRSRSAATLNQPERASDGRIKRSEAAKHGFMESEPCPSTGMMHGPCPGYVVDHIKPLACGGADEPSNMQWQTTQAGAEKDKWERAGCKPAK